MSDEQKPTGLIDTLGDREAKQREVERTRARRPKGDGPDFTQIAVYGAVGVIGLVFAAVIFGLVVGPNIGPAEGAVTPRPTEAPNLGVTIDSVRSVFNRFGFGLDESVEEGDRETFSGEDDDQPISVTVTGLQGNADSVTIVWTIADNEDDQETQDLIIDQYFTATLRTAPERGDIVAWVEEQFAAGDGEASETFGLYEVETRVAGDEREITISALQ
ncbi:MAG: hypothetical protein GYB68_18465 [Chloroflexi bacterium]|nr:hypothetical protein [Chloroflexota bacterium]